MTRSDKLEAFAAKAEQKFINWFEKFEIHLKREKLTEESDKIDELFFYLEGEPLDWFQERKSVGSLPVALAEIKQLLNEKWGTGIQRICRMSNGELVVYIRQFEEITKCLPAAEELKIKLFTNGLDSKLYPLVASQKFKSYQEIKSFVQDCYVRMKEDAPEQMAVFRARGEQSKSHFQNSQASTRVRTGEYGPRSSWTEEEIRLYNEMRCFKCKKLGHKSRFCNEKTRARVVGGNEEPHLNSAGQH